MDLVVKLLDLDANFVPRVNIRYTCYQVFFTNVVAAYKTIFPKFSLGDSIIELIVFFTVLGVE